MSARSEGMRGTVVWVCENGHVDQLHKSESNYTACCGTCRDGSVCEPRFTPGRRSKEQRERDKLIGESFPRFEEERLRRRNRREVPEPVSSEVKVTRPDGSVEVVDADAFSPEAIPAPFTLTQVQRQQILSAEAKMPTITFPRNRPAEVAADAPWPPAEPGDVVPVSEHVFIVVLGFSDRIDAHVLAYEVRDRRPEHDGTPIKATKPLDPKVPTTTLTEQWRPEREPARVPHSEVRKMVENVVRADLERLKRVRGQHAVHLEELADQPRDVRWPIRKTIEALDFRIGEVEKQLREPERQRALKQRRAQEAKDAA